MKTALSKSFCFMRLQFDLEELRNSDTYSHRAQVVMTIISAYVTKSTSLVVER
jgi:hypothetical protein